MGYGGFYIKKYSYFKISRNIKMEYNPFSLKGKTILVTGASSGIGRVTAIECSKMGANVIITARNEERLKETLHSMSGGGHSMIICDLSKTDDLQGLIDMVPEIQGLVNNAGFTKLAPIQFIKEEDFTNIVKVNTFAPIFLFQKLLKNKKIKNNASVVFTGSMAGLGFSTVGNAMYTASKGAISAYIRTAALELASKNIRINAVCPSMIDTGILASGTISQDQLQEDLKNYPLGRYGRPEEIAWSIIYLLSDASSFTTGLNLQIDGGVTLK